MRTSYFRSSEPSSSVQYVRPNQTFPTAALIDYVVRDTRRQLAYRASFLATDNFKPTPEDDSTENYFGAAADDCVDLKAANYILQKRRSLQDDYE
ncbi:hypothetical protein KSS87_021198 [Heliosperma pusillum]|nr:hypothetical protein KSS87_021198 [Heliosperma pusillum]